MCTNGALQNKGIKIISGVSRRQTNQVIVFKTTTISNQHLNRCTANPSKHINTYFTLKAIYHRLLCETYLLLYTIKYRANLIKLTDHMNPPTK